MPDDRIQASVGMYNNGNTNCYNLTQDVATITSLLNSIPDAEGGTNSSPLAQSASPTDLFRAILNFQGTQNNLGRVPRLSVDGHVDPEAATLARLNQIAHKVQPIQPDPATDPGEKDRVEALLAVHRPSVPVLIAQALQVLLKCKAALDLAKRSPFQAAQALRENQLGIDGLNRHFHISGNNLELIDAVVNRYQKLAEKVPRLPLDQAATDYPTFVQDDPEDAFNQDGTPAKVPAFSDPNRKMFFNPIYRPFVAGVKEPFGGVAPIALKAIQIHEMCHFYLNMIDLEPAGSTATQCLASAQSYQRFVMQLALGKPFPVKNNAL
ncbi:MAG TPA: hypothetical protein VNZ03_35285 [Terriglobales bacterium]|jgi:hypothetical protein|nr:hypothetical protein [Terriglobales bacterium]